ncbi:hypothetical protein MUP01_02075 [Candidatus Bathyarchaeota archaeon]|nr:hypothetical protein [Candidatus Bathyarchaeota archaeon]
MKAKILSLAIVGMMLLSIAGAIPVNATPANSMYVVPSAYNFNTGAQSVGYKFNVSVWMNLNVVSFAWQVKLYFNTAFLKCNMAGYLGAGDVDSTKSEYFAGHATTPLTPVIDNVAGTVLHGESLGGADSAAAADKRLMWAELEITAAPGKYATFTSAIGINNVDSYVLDPDLASVTITKNDGSVTYVWTLPAKPHLEVVPSATITYPKTAVQVGKLFDVQVILKGIDPAWACHNVTFTLTYDCATPAPAEILEVSDMTAGPLWTVSTFDNTTLVGTITGFVGFPTSTPSGDVVLLTVKFRITYQDVFPTNDNAPLVLSDIVVFDTLEEIQTTAPVNGNVVVEGYQAASPPYLTVSSVTMGPGPVLGQHFIVTVMIMNVSAQLNLIGLDFRLTYDPALITPVAVYEGDFLPWFAALQPGSLGTFFISYFEAGPPEHVLVGNMIYPNGTGWWNLPMPSTNGIAATIEFEVAYQSFGDADLSCELGIFDEHFVGLDNMDDQNPIDLGNSPAVNGTYTITTSWPGRVIDLYDQYPAPFGGQGHNMPSDMFWPQKQVELYANVTYNYWPVQQKDVAFEVRDNHGNVVTIQVARTDADGVAHSYYRIPWPCDHPEDYFGVWTITATVDVACIVINDTMQFHFDYMVEIFKVDTDKFEYNHCDDVVVTIKYGSHAQQIYPVVLRVVLEDELGVPVAQAHVCTTVGGTQFCAYKNGTVTLTMHIPKYAFAGIAKIHVNAYNTLPTMGGSTWCPEYGLLNPFGYAWPIGSTTPLIAIQPY